MSLFFLFHKDLSTARGAFWLLLGSRILLFLFSLAVNPPPPCLFFEADVNRCLQWAVYLSLPRLVLSSDPRVNALQRSIILLLRAPDGGMKGGKGERDIQRLWKSGKQSNNKHLRQILWLVFIIWRYPQNVSHFINNPDYAIVLFSFFCHVLGGVFKFISSRQCCEADGCFQFPHLFSVQLQILVSLHLELGNGGAIFLSWLRALGKCCENDDVLSDVAHETAGQLVWVHDHDKIITLHTTPRSNHNYICKLWVDWRWKCLIRRRRAS